MKVEIKQNIRNQKFYEKFIKGDYNNSADNEIRIVLFAFVFFFAAVVTKSF